MTRVSRVRQPAAAPGPVRVDGVDHARHQDAEQDVPVITGGTGGGTGEGTGEGTGGGTGGGTEGGTGCTR